jgi:hypothetical protein
MATDNGQYGPYKWWEIVLLVLMFAALAAGMWFHLLA